MLLEVIQGFISRLLGIGLSLSGLILGVLHNLGKLVHLFGRTLAMHNPGHKKKPCKINSLHRQKFKLTMHCMYLVQR
jgi:hypothetical protein